jgi:hypothetical protein
MKKVRQILLVRAGHQNTADEDICLSDDTFFESFIEDIDEKPKRMTQKELLDLYENKIKLSKEQKLVKSVLDDCLANNGSKMIFDQALGNAKKMHAFRRKYKNYLRLKRFIPLGLVAPFTGSELFKTAYAAALGSKSISLTLLGLIGYSLPGFFFFHMSSYYAPDSLKPICTFCKLVIGGPFWVIDSLTDEVLSSAEEAVFGEIVPIDITQTGVTIPGDIGDFEKLQDFFKDLKPLSKKSY